jgi:hypothetical protein
MDYNDHAYNMKELSLKKLFALGFVHKNLTLTVIPTLKLVDMYISSFVGT